jgi:hypothetical protein
MAEIVQISLRRDAFKQDAICVAAYEDAPEYKSGGAVEYLGTEQVYEPLQRIGGSTRDTQTLFVDYRVAPAECRLQF